MEAAWVFCFVFAFGFLSFKLPSGGSQAFLYKHEAKIKLVVFKADVIGNICYKNVCAL